MRIRSLTGIAAVGVAGVLVLSACSNSSSGGSKGGGLGGGTSSSSSSGGSTGSGGSGQTVTIGFQGPLSGDNQQLGINEDNAFKLAISQANASGNLGFTLKGEESDDVGSPDTAPAAAAKLIQDTTVVGVIGPSFSGATKAVGDAYGAVGMAMISASATNPSLTTLGFKTFHRIIPSDNVEGTQGADWLARKGLKNVFVVDDLSDYGKGVADAVEKELKAKGVKVERQGVDAKTTNYSSIAATVKNSGAQALFYGGYDAQAALFARALTTAGFTGIKVTGNGGKSSVFTKGAGASGNGWYFTCGCLDATTAPAAKTFNADYTKAYNTPPSTYSPEAFDATNAMIAAIKAAKASGSITRASVEDAVNKLDYHGITTEVKFDSTGEVVATAQTVNLYEQTGGEIKLVGNIKTQS